MLGIKHALPWGRFSLVRLSRLQLRKEEETVLDGGGKVVLALGLN